MDTITPHALAFAPGQMQLVTGTAASERVPPVRRVLRAASRWRWFLLGGVALGAPARAANRGSIPRTNNSRSGGSAGEQGRPPSAPEDGL